MPDGTYIPSEVNNSGTSLDSVFLLQADTKQRFDNVFAGAQAPMKYSLPSYEPDLKGLSQYVLTDGPTTNGSLKAGLFSEDANQRDLAWNIFNKDFSKDPVHAGVGVPHRFPYEQSMDKYINSDLGYNPYLSIEQNESQNYDYDYMTHNIFSRTFRNLGVGVSRFFGGVAAKTIQTFGNLGSMIWNGVEEMIDPKGNNFIADVADNTLARWAQNWETDMKNSNLLSVFKPKGWQDMGFFQKLTQAPLWTDEFADGAAFMGEMILSSYLLGGVGKLSGLARLGETEINLASKLGRFGDLAQKGGKALDYTLRAATGAKDISGIGRWAFLTTSESAMEAAGKYDAYTADLKEQRSRGLNNLSDDEIKSKAGEAAASSFRTNLAILSLSNAFENKFIFEPILGKAKKVFSGRRVGADIGEYTADAETSLQGTPKTFDYKTKLGKLFDWKNPDSRLRFYGTRMLASIGAEGYWEENAQLAIERLSSTDDYRNAGFIGKKSKFFKQLLKQTGASLVGDDPEAAENIGLGGLIGVIGTGVGAKVSQERRGLVHEDIGRLAEYEKRRREFMSFRNIYDTDENGKQTVNPDKAAALFQGIYKTMDKQQAADKALDPKLRKYHQISALSDYVYASKKAGLYERVVDRLENVHQLSPEQISEMGFNPETVTLNEVIDRTKQLGKAYDESQLSIVNKNNTEKDNNDDEDRKYTLYKAKSIALASETIAKEYFDDANNKIRASTFSDAIKGETSDVQAYNTLVHQEKALQAFEGMSQDHNNFYKPYIAAEKARIADEKGRIEKVLDEKVKNGELEKIPYGVIVSPKTYKGTPEEVLQQIRSDLRSQIKYAETKSAATQYRFIEDRLSNSVDGLPAYRSYRDFLNSVHEMDDKSDDIALHTVRKDEDGTFSVVSPAGNVVAKGIKTEEEANTVAKDNDDVVNEVEKEETPEEVITPEMVIALKGLNYSPDDIKNMDVNQAKDLINRKVKKPVVPDITVDEESDTDFEEPADEPVTILSGQFANETSLKTVNDQVLNINELGEVLPIDVPSIYSRLKDNVYNMDMNDFILSELPTLISAGVYEPYIVNDKPEWQARFFRIVKNSDKTISAFRDGEEKVRGTQEQVDTYIQNPSYKLGQVIVFMNSAGEVKNFASGNVAAFSFNENAFNKGIGQRAGVRDKRSSDSEAVFAEEKDRAKQARDLLRNNTVDKIKIGIGRIFGGVEETTAELVPVEERFPGFTWRLVTGGAEKINGKEFSGKKTVITVGNQSFEAITRRIEDNPELRKNIESLMSRKYSSQAEALRVANYLKNFVYVRKGINYFVATPDGRVIYIENKKQATVQEVLASRINVKRSAMTEGYDKLEVVNGNLKSTHVSAEDYNKFIREQFITNRKVVRTADEKGLYLNPVNAYFTFTLPESIKRTEKPFEPTKKPEETPKAEVKPLGEKELQRLLAISTSAELEKERLRIRDEKIDLTASEKELLRNHLDNLKAKEKASKPQSRGSVIKDTDVEEIEDVSPLQTFLVAGETISIDFSKDDNNFTGKVPTTYAEAAQIIAAIQTNPSLVAIPSVSVNEATFAIDLRALLVGIKGGDFIVLDKNFKRIPNEQASKMKAIEKQYKEMMTNCKV